MWAFLVDFPCSKRGNKFTKRFVEIYTVLQLAWCITISGGILVKRSAKVIVGYFFFFLTQFSSCDFGNKNLVWLACDLGTKIQKAKENIL